MNTTTITLMLTDVSELLRIFRSIAQPVPSGLDEATLRTILATYADVAAQGARLLDPDGRVTLAIEAQSQQGQQL